MPISWWLFVHHFSQAIQLAQEARWAPLFRGAVMGSFRGPTWGNRGSPVCARFDCRVQCAVVVGHAQATSCLTGARPVSLGMSPRLSVSVDFISALSRGRERVFCPNLSPFLSCCTSSLNREGEGSSRPTPSPASEQPPLLLPFHRMRSCIAAVPK